MPLTSTQQSADLHSLYNTPQAIPNPNPKSSLLFPTPDPIHQAHQQTINHKPIPTQKASLSFGPSFHTGPSLHPGTLPLPRSTVGTKDLSLSPRTRTNNQLSIPIAKNRSSVSYPASLNQASAVSATWPDLVFGANKSTSRKTVSLAPR